jgi:Domain of unknown function (DUF1992)
MTEPLSPQEKREQRLKTQDEQICSSCVFRRCSRFSCGDSLSSGELRAAPSWGKPQTFGDGYDQTPDELRMSMKILKDSGYAPPEVELMREIAALQASLEGAPDDAATRARHQRLAEMRQHLALRLEKLRGSGQL